MNPEGRRGCRLCGQACRTVMAGLRDTRFGAPGEFEVRQCLDCGLEQTWPVPSEKELKEFYERFYNWGGEKTSHYVASRARFFQSSLYRLWLRKDGDISFHLRRGQGRLLDVGCNEGRGLSFYAGNGFQVEGLEINERAAQVARQQGFTVHTTGLEHLSPEAPFDVVVLANVLEHTPDPVAMLASIRGLLRPEGQVWISCPNTASSWRQVFGPHWVNWHVPYHLWHFSPQTLAALLMGTRFRPVEMRTCTPALWFAQSICSLMGGRQGRPNRLMQTVPLIAGLMLLGRSLILPLLEPRDGKLRGDCLMATAVPLPDAA